MTSLIEVRGLRKDFAVAGQRLFARAAGVVHAVGGVSFTIPAAETLGLVGESGCGKSTIARLVLGLETPTAGTVLFKGRDIRELSSVERAAFRRSVAAVFQDPWSSLNPWMRVGDIVGEPILINTKSSAIERRRRVAEVLDEVGLSEAQARLYPHELSGGQRQRVGIARALALRPELIVLDEPVSALDVSIRAQVLNLLRDLQGRHGLSYLLIAHHLATMRFLCHSLAVVYLGLFVEHGDARTILAAPRHPYTRALVAAALPSEPGVPLASPALRAGEVPSPIDPPSGCHFHPRCPHVMERCVTEVPQLVGSDHLVSCFLEDSIEKQRAIVQPV